MNSKSLAFFSSLIEHDSISEQSVKIHASNDYSHLDAAFILQYATEKTKILDIGSGTGLILNKIAPYVGHITAVERFPEFTQFIAKSPTISIVHEDIMQFSTKEQFNLITCFGIMQYLSKEEAELLYSRYYTNLAPDGKIIIKQQFGVDTDVYINTYLHHHEHVAYHSYYRHIDAEVMLLSSVGYQDIEVIDIYPEECNRWENTHFYAIVASRK